MIEFDPARPGRQALDLDTSVLPDRDRAILRGRCVRPSQPLDEPDRTAAQWLALLQESNAKHAGADAIRLDDALGSSVHTLGASSRRIGTTEVARRTERAATLLLGSVGRRHIVVRTRVVAARVQHEPQPDSDGGDDQEDCERPT